MTLPDECPHSIALTPTECSMCLETARLRAEDFEPDTVHGSPIFVAKHGGQCPSCDLPIRPGERIRKWSDQRYRHERCTS